MPLRPLLPPPGVNTQRTALLNGTAWSQCDKIRFKEGCLEKLGGCARLTSETFDGTCRGLHPFSDLASNIYLAIGTDQRLEIYHTGHIYDITPIRGTSVLAAPFSTTSGSPFITVTDGTVPVAVGDWINIENVTYLSGLFLFGLYKITSIGFGSYAFDAGANANATFTGAGQNLSFHTTLGSSVVTLTLGSYSFTNNQKITVHFSTAVGGLTVPAGQYFITVILGVATFVPVPGGPVATSTAAAFENGGFTTIGYALQSQQEGGGATLLRQWTMGNWGQNLVATPTNGTIYQWVPPIVQPLVPAAALANAPSTITGIFVSMAQQQITAYGAFDPVSALQDPMLIRWCNVADNTDWTATAINQAGSFRLPVGSRIIGGIQGPNQGLIWTDIDLWAQQYVGYPFVYSFNQIGWGCGLLSQRAMAKVGPSVIWAGSNEFFIYEGTGVRSIPCSVWDQFFPLIDRTKLDAVFAWSNSDFDEVFFEFPTAGSNGQCTNYVKLNVRDSLWDYGTLSRSAGTDRSVVGAPISTDYTGLLQQHEIATDFDGVAFDSFAVTGWVGLAEGDTFTFIERVHPDFLTTPANGQSNVSLTFTDYVTGGTPVTKGPYTFTNGSNPYQVVRGRGRYVQVKVQWNQLGTFGRLGRLEGLATPAGRR